MTLNYFIKDTDNDLKKIFIRFRDGKRFDRVAWTEKQTLDVLWNPDKQEIRNKTLTFGTDNVAQTILESREVINNHLTDLKTYLIAKYNEDFSKSKTIEKDWLKDAIKSFSNRVDITETSSKKYFLSDWMQDWLDNPKNLINAKTGKPLAHQTVKSYKSNLAKLKNFQAHKNKKYRFEELTHKEFYTSYVHYCRSVEKLSDSTIGKAVTILKTFFGLIKDEELPISLDFEKRGKFVSMSDEASDTYLNEDEILNIFNLDLSKNNRLDNVRDWLIIGVWTGLRISDFKRLDISNIKNNIITIVTQKTKKRVSLGMHPQLKAVLDKRGGQFPKKISDQKFNEYVKEVVQLAGITQEIESAKMINIGNEDDKVFRKIKGIYPKYDVISSHTCRRSFATNLYKTKKLPLTTLMSLTGHKSETQFIEYIKISDEENAMIMNDYLNNKLNDDNLIAPLQIAN